MKTNTTYNVIPTAAPAAGKGYAPGYDDSYGSGVNLFSSLM
jgi:hypothetical protein